jgi:hypothetical protein
VPSAVAAQVGSGDVDDAATSPQQIAQLRDEIQILKKRLAEADTVRAAGQQNGADTKKDGLDELDKRYKELKTKHHALMLERTEMQQVIKKRKNFKNFSLPFAATRGLQRSNAAVAGGLKAGDEASRHGDSGLIKRKILIIIFFRITTSPTRPV